MVIDVGQWCKRSCLIVLLVCVLSSVAIGGHVLEISPEAFGLPLRTDGDTVVGVWDNHIEKPVLDCYLSDGDLSMYDTVAFDIFSAKANGARMTLVFYSNNPATDGSDYYYLHITVDWTGLKRFELRTDQLRASRSPLGWDRIDLIRISASGWQNTPLADTSLTLSPFRFSKGSTDDRASLTVTVSTPPPLTGPPEDTRVTVPITSFGLPSVSGIEGFEGGIARWGDHPVHDVISCTSPPDLSRVNRVTFLVHSAKANNAQLTLQFRSENKETEGTDSYLTHLFVDWEGWKVITIDFADLRVGRSPLGWDKIDTIQFHASGWNATPKADTDLLISDLYFPQSGFDESTPMLSTLRAEHPRLLITSEGFARIRERIAAGDPQTLQWYASLQSTVRGIMAAGPSQYEISDGLRLLATSVQVLDRVEALAMLYQLEGDMRYVERAWQELEAAGSFPDWNPRHFLDTAEMSRAFAIAYDWLYDAWTPEQRRFIREALVRLGLTPALQSYRRTAPSEWSGWVNRRKSNWNLVCNAGIGMGALAIAEEYPELAEEILRSSVRSIKNSIVGFAPDGGWEEGLGYWSYSIDYLVGYLGSLETALGTDFGLGDTPGLAEAGDFPIYLTGPTKEAFNFGDNGKGIFRRPEFFWLAQRYDKPEYDWWLRHVAGVSSHPRNFLWGLSGSDQRPDHEYPAPDRYFRDAEVVSLRSAWNDERACFVGFKGGANPGGHGDLDLGSFVFDALGVRWVEELGKDDYNLDGYFAYGPGGKRWDYYRKRAEGQNTLLINHDGGPGQNNPAFAPIVFFASKEGEALAIAHLTSAYTPHVTDARRGVALFDNRRQLLIQDEVTSQNPADIWWFMHTRAAVELSEDGRSAILSRNNKKVLARVPSPPEASFQLLPARPLEASPDPIGQDLNSGLHKLAIHLTGVTELRLVVQLTPLEDYEYAPLTPTVYSLDEWQQDVQTPLWAALPRLRLRLPVGARLSGIAGIGLELAGTARFSDVTVKMGEDILYQAKDLPSELIIDTYNYSDADRV